MSNINVNNITPLAGTSGTVSVSGSLLVSGSVTANGNIILGDSVADSVSLGAEVSSSIIPDANNTYDLGSVSKAWKTLSVNEITASGDISSSGDIFANNLTLTGDFTSTSATAQFTNITASGNISASGTIISNVMTPTTITKVNTTNITSSGGISSSGIIDAAQFNTRGLMSLSTDSSTTGRVFGGSDVTAIEVGRIGTSNKNISLFGQVTASGDISGSSTTITAGGNLTIGGNTILGNAVGDTHTITGHITASHNISASGTITSNVMTPTTITNVNTTHITASGNISSSATTGTNQFGAPIVLDNFKYVRSKRPDGTLQDVIGINSGDFIDIGTTSIPLTIDASSLISLQAGSGEIKLKANVGPITLNSNSNTTAVIIDTIGGHITASGNISASATSTGSFGALRLSGLVNQGSEATAVVIDGSNIVGTRELGSNAFTSTTIGTTTNALTVDNATLQLNSGTTFNGSAARTISIKDGGVDSNALAADITVTSLTATHITASGNISASGTLDVTGNVNFDGNLDVDGTANLDIVDIDGAVDMASNLTIAGTISNVDTTHITASGNISSSGIIYANQFFTDQKLALDTDGSTTGKVFGDASVTAIEVGRTGTSNKNISLLGPVTASTTISASGEIEANTFKAAGNVDFNGDLDVDGTTNLDVVDIDGAVDMASTLVVASHITSSGNISSSGDISSFKYVEATQTVAAAGSTIGDATAIAATAGQIFVTTNNNSKGVKLPAVSSVTIGTTFTIHNTVDGNTLEVYPFGDDRIFPLADDAPATLPANTAMVVTAFSADGYIGYFTTVIS